MLSVVGYGSLRGEEIRDPPLKTPSHAQEPDTTIKSPSNKSSKRRRMERKAPIVRALFSKTQVAQLEKRFREQSFLSKEERQELARDVGITDRQVMIWFQNRRGRLKKRGPLDGAYNPAKLQEINVRRPYPFLCGIITNQHQYGTQATSHQPFSVYPKEVQSHIETVIGQMPDQGRNTLKEITREPSSTTGNGDTSVSTPPPNVTVFDMATSGSAFRNVTPAMVNSSQSVSPHAHDAINSQLRSQCCGDIATQGLYNQTSKFRHRYPVATQELPGSFMHDLVSSSDFHSSQSLYINTGAGAAPTGSGWHQHTPLLTTLPPHAPAHTSLLSSPWCEQVPHMTVTPQPPHAPTHADHYAHMPGYLQHYGHAHQPHNYAHPWAYQEQNLQHAAQYN